MVERRTWVPDPGCRIIACVDVQPVGDVPTSVVRREALWELAVRRVERCVRPTDSICMLGANRLAVSFGNGGHRVPPSVLGRRLARAMGDHLAIGGKGLDVQVSVGISAGPSDVDAEELTGAALAAVRSARERMAARATADTHALVTVTHLPATLVELPNRAQHANGDGCESTAPVVVRRLVRRALVPMGAWSEDDADDEVMGGANGDGRARPEAPSLRVLVIDPGAMNGEPPRLATEAVAAISRRTGAETTVSPSSDPERVVLDLYVTEPHVVVVALQGDRMHAHGDARPWDAPARLVRAVREAGVPVVAIAVGASAAAVAACIEQGALGLLDADDLSHELALAAKAAGSATQNGAGGSESEVYTAADANGRRFPAPFAALVDLTPSERRVLFHMMEGRSAVEIADTLVVSLPTVRSHIRSILRKLNVNSQLAAVAIANGTCGSNGFDG